MDYIRDSDYLIWCDLYASSVNVMCHGSSHTELITHVIIPIIVAIVVLALLIIAITWFVIRRTKRRKRKPKEKLEVANGIVKVGDKKGDAV